MKLTFNRLEPVVVNAVDFHDLEDGVAFIDDDKDLIFKALQGDNDRVYIIDNGDYVSVFSGHVDTGVTGLVTSLTYTYLGKDGNNHIKKIDFEENKGLLSKFLVAKEIPASSLFEKGTVFLPSESSGIGYFRLDDNVVVIFNRSFDNKHQDILSIDFEQDPKTVVKKCVIEDSLDVCKLFKVEGWEIA